MDGWLKFWLKIGVASLLGCWALQYGSTDAQVPAGRPRTFRAPGAGGFDEGDENKFVDGVFLPPDRGVKRRLEMAKQLSDDRRYGEAARYLGSLLEESEDYFFRPDSTGNIYRSLKSEAGRLISEMPEEGRDSYELQFGAKAQRLVTEAISQGDVLALSDVSRRFFYTRSGTEATFLLARNHLDHGRPLAAALLLERLAATPSLAARYEPMLSLYLASAWFRADMPERARVTLLAMKREYPRANLQIGGKSVALFHDDSQALAWLEKQIGKGQASNTARGDDWLVYRGNASRGGLTQGGRPLLNPRWRVRVAHHPSIEKLISKRRQDYLDKDLPAVSSMHPLAVGGVVLMRDSLSLLAVDFNSGKLIWEAERLAEDDFAHLLANSQPSSPFNQGSHAMDLVRQRMWEDPVYGTMSSDGEHVFIVEDLANDLSTSPQIIRGRGQRQGNAGGARNHNRLTARDLKTEGKLKWEVGGATGKDEPKLAGVFFLGPPLPLLGRLYVIAEMKKQEIRLLALSAKTGSLEWSQQLCVVEQDIAHDRIRRVGGATPSFADGVLVCPTSAGAAVAVDLSTRSLLWGYQYPRASQNNINHFNQRLMGGDDGLLADRWLDSTATISQGHVLLTPIESEYLYCLKLLNGEVEWKLDRSDSLYTACVDRGNVVLVGRNHMRAYRLSNGKEAWSKPLELPDDSMPSGRGFYTKGSYFLPLSSAEVIEVDLETGQIISRAKSRLGDVPGNLICHRGEIISQGVDFVETFYQIESLRDEVTRKLAQTPDDPRALAQLGEIKRDDGNLGEAIELFDRSFRLAADEYTRELLVDSLLEGLRTDFTANRTKAGELEALIQGKQQQAAYLRLVAGGLKQSGETMNAFESYLRLLDQLNTDANPGVRAELEPVADSLLVRRERWLAAELAALYADAAEVDRQQIDRRLAVRLQAAQEEKSAVSLRKFLATFDRLPIADQAREELVEILSRSGSFMERELLLRRLERSSDATKVRAAISRLAALYDETKRPALAAVQYRRLQAEFGDLVCLDNKTGKQIVNEIESDNPVRKLLADAVQWPVGLVTEKPNAMQGLISSQNQSSFGVRIDGPTAPFFNNMILTIDASQTQMLAGRDSLGHTTFRAMLRETGSPRMNGRINGFNPVGNFNNPSLNFARVNGNLLLVWTGYQIVAVDTLRPPIESTDRVLWTQDINELIPGIQVLQQRPVSMPWGGLRNQLQDANGRPIGSMGPVNFDGVCFQRLRDLVCVDPLSGETLWTRKNIPGGSDLFGDEELLFVAPPEGGEAIVLRAIDGALVGKRDLPPVDQRMETFGRLMIVWDSKDGKQTITARDAWTNEEKWVHSFDVGAKATIVPNEAVGVLEPSGRFVLMRLADGQKIVEQQLKPEKMLVNIHIIRSSDQYLLVTNGAMTNNEPNLIIQAPQGNNPLVNGWMYAFARDTGRMLWPKPLSLRSEGPHGLILSQPSEVPLQFFLSIRTDNAGKHKTTVKLFVVDKRNGRVVFNHNIDQMGNFEIVGEPTQKAVALILPGKTISFLLTDEALPAEDKPATPAKKGDMEAIGGAVGRGLKRLLIGGGVERIFEKDE